MDIFRKGKDKREERMKNKPVLHLNLKKKWFDMILSGEKKEEYREMSTYWRHIYNDMFYTEGKGNQIKVFIKKVYYKPEDIIICFSNGYAKNRRQFFIECKNIHVGCGREEWGAEKNINYFVLSLGDLIGL
jgi:hypothetical protein